MSIGTPSKATREPLIGGSDPLIFKLDAGVIGFVNEVYLVDTGDDFYIEYDADVGFPDLANAPESTRKKYLDILAEKVQNWFSEALYAKLAAPEEANGGEPNQD